MSKGDIVISVQRKFVERIIAGKKAAELRRRAPGIQPGCRVWIDTKAPEAVISVCVTVERVTGHFVHGDCHILAYAAEPNDV